MTHPPDSSYTTPKDDAFDDYTSPHEAAERLHTLSLELEKHNLSPDQAEELRSISARFNRHFNGLETFTQKLRDTARAFQW